MISFQANRYELKYLISESQAEAVRREVLPYLVRDGNTESKTGYHVQSLYLDSLDLHCYNQTMAGEKNRFKIRIRKYDDEPTSPVFLEIKRRVTGVIQKSRTVVSREHGEKILLGHKPATDMLIKDTPAQRASLLEFCQLRDQLAATGKVFVDYWREAYQGAVENQFRVTFDREIRGRLYQPGAGLMLPADSKMSKIGDVVLEMKFINEPAKWMVGIARRYNLQPISVPKYIECIDAVDGVTTSLLRRGEWA